MTDVTVTGDLRVDQESSMGGQLTVQANSFVSGFQRVGALASIGLAQTGALVVEDTASFTGSDSTVSITNRLEVGGALSLTGGGTPLEVTGGGTFSGGLRFPVALVRITSATTLAASQTGAVVLIAGAHVATLPTAPADGTFYQFVMTAAATGSISSAGTGDTMTFVDGAAVLKSGVTSATAGADNDSLALVYDSASGWRGLTQAVGFV